MKVIQLLDASGKVLDELEVASDVAQVVLKVLGDHVAVVEAPEPEPEPEPKYRDSDPKPSTRTTTKRAKR